MEEIEINGSKFRKYLTSEQINDAVKRIAAQIEDDYAGLNPLFLIVMKGAIFFAADLIRNVKIDSQIDVISAKSYGSNMISSGKVSLKTFEDNFRGRDIIIIEDIVDSGFTLTSLIGYIKGFSPKSVVAATILSKPTARKTEVSVKYVGIEIPELFVIGYGLDYAEHGRQLKDIYILSSDQ